MRTRSFIVLAVALFVLVVGAVGVYAYDKSRNDVIAKGIKAGGVDLSGMKPREARERGIRAGGGALWGMRRREAREPLRRELAEPLQRPVIVKYRGHHYRLG